MRVVIDNTGNHEPPGSSMVVDGHGMLVDLSPLGGLFADKSVSRIEWQPVLERGNAIERGIDGAGDIEGREEEFFLSSSEAINSQQKTALLQK